MRTRYRKPPPPPPEPPPRSFPCRRCRASRPTPQGCPCERLSSRALDALLALDETTRLRPTAALRDLLNLGLVRSSSSRKLWTRTVGGDYLARALEPTRPVTNDEEDAPDGSTVPGWTRAGRTWHRTIRAETPTLRVAFDLVFLRMKARAYSERERGHHLALPGDHRTLCGILAASDRWQSRELEPGEPAESTCPVCDARVAPSLTRPAPPSEPPLNPT